MISERALARLTVRVEDLCPDMWSNDAYRLRGTTCRANLATSYHQCVGDVGHGGKHVCRCGASREVWL